MKKNWKMVLFALAAITCALPAVASADYQCTGTLTENVRIKDIVLHAPQGTADQFDLRDGVPAGMTISSEVDYNPQLFNGDWSQIIYNGDGRSNADGSTDWDFTIRKEISTPFTATIITECDAATLKQTNVCFYPIQFGGDPHGGAPEPLAMHSVDSADKSAGLVMFTGTISDAVDLKNSSQSIDLQVIKNSIDPKTNQSTSDGGTAEIVVPVGQAEFILQVGSSNMNGGSPLASSMRLSCARE